jgi:hypothetical protein
MHFPMTSDSPDPIRYPDTPTLRPPSLPLIRPARRSLITPNPAIEPANQPPAFFADASRARRL